MNGKFYCLFFLVLAGCFQPSPVSPTEAKKEISGFTKILQNLVTTMVAEVKFKKKTSNLPAHLAKQAKKKPIAIALMDGRFINTNLHFPAFVNLELQNIFSKTTLFQVLPRDAVKKTLKEMNLDMSDFYDENTGPKIGKWKRSDVYLLSEMHKYGPTYKLYLRLIDITSGLIISSQSTFIPQAHLDPFLKAPKKPQQKALAYVKRVRKEKKNPKKSQKIPKKEPWVKSEKPGMVATFHLSRTALVRGKPAHLKAIFRLGGSWARMAFLSMSLGDLARVKKLHKRKLTDLQDMIWSDFGQVRERLYNYVDNDCYIDCKCQGGPKNLCNCGRPDCQSPPPHSPKLMALCPPLNLSVVLDISGSMKETIPGRSMTKIQHAKKAILKLLPHFKDGDIISLVPFADRIYSPLSPRQAKASKAEIERLVRSLTPGRGTNLYRAIEKGFQFVLQNYHKNTLNRIIVITDGEPTVGKTTPYQFKSLIWNIAEKGISLSVFALGKFNWKILNILSFPYLGNRGNLHTINDMNKIGPMVFHDVMQIMFARKIKLHFYFREALKVKILGPHKKGKGGELIVELGNLDLRSVRTVALELDLPPLTEDISQIGGVKIEYFDLQNQKKEIYVPLRIQLVDTEFESRETFQPEVELAVKIKKAKEILRPFLQRELFPRRLGDGIKKAQGVFR